MNRKQFLLSALIVPLIAACTPIDEKKDLAIVEMDVPLSLIPQSTIATSNSLIFGDTKKPNNITFILNLGDKASLDFLLNHFSEIQNRFEYNEPFEILLVDLPGRTPTFTPDAEEMTYVLSSVAMYSYAESPDIFMNFLQTVIKRWNEQETFVREDVIYLAQELELLPNIDITGVNAISQEYVEEMTEEALSHTETSPAILTNNSLWNGNIDNPIEVSGLLKK